MNVGIESHECFAREQVRLEPEFLRPNSVLAEINMVVAVIVVDYSKSVMTPPEVRERLKDLRRGLFHAIESPTNPDERARK